MIMYFSGTGNSRYAALRLHSVVGGQLVDLNRRIKDHDYQPLVSRSPFILVAPTYAWSLPRVVEEYLRQTPMQGDDRLYAVRLELIDERAQGGLAVQHIPELQALIARARARGGQALQAALRTL